MRHRSRSSRPDIPTCARSATDVTIMDTGVLDTGIGIPDTTTLATILGAVVTTRSAAIITTHTTLIEPAVAPITAVTVRVLGDTEAAGPIRNERLEIQNICEVMAIGAPSM